jgi:spermidine synthase
LSAPLLFQPTPYVLYGFPNARRLASVASPHQLIEVWDTPQLGRLFTLDGRPMTSVGDEFIYHECMVHPIAVAHPAPRTALVLGGGDGGAARQLLRHPDITRVVVAELDAEVVRLTREYLPQVHGGAFDDQRVELVIGDAADFVAAAQEQFDLVVFDLTPPDSPAARLYTPTFYAQLKRVMSPAAALSLHLGAPYYHAARAAALLDGLRSSFAVVRTMGAFVPLVRLAMDDGHRERHARPRRADPGRAHRAPHGPANRRSRLVRRRCTCRTLLGIPRGAR